MGSVISARLRRVRLHAVEVAHVSARRRMREAPYVRRPVVVTRRTERGKCEPNVFPRCRVIVEVRCANLSLCDSERRRPNAQIEIAYDGPSAPAKLLRALRLEINVPCNDEDGVARVE